MDYPFNLTISNKIAKSRAKYTLKSIDVHELMDRTNGFIERVWNDYPRFMYNNENIENRISRAAVRADKGYSNIRN